MVLVALAVVAAFLGHDLLMAAVGHHGGGAVVVAAAARHHAPPSGTPSADPRHPEGCGIGQQAAHEPGSTLARSSARESVPDVRPATLRAGPVVGGSPARMRPPSARRAELQVYRI